MAEDTTAFVIPLHQASRKRKDKAASPRAKAPRRRKKQEAKAATVTGIEPPSPESLIPPEFLSAGGTLAEPAVAQDLSGPGKPTATRVAPGAPVMPLRHHIAPVLLAIAALALACVGITINGWYARSLGSSDVAGWLFLAVGAAADVVALVMPSCAASLWRARERVTAMVGWSVWLMTFVFAVTAGIGFASTNISDVTQARASRVTPAVTTAQAALADAMAARDRECKGGVGKFCREREAAVADRRQLLDAAMSSVEKIADPQTDAAIKLVTWTSRGLLRPTPDDFAMLRLVLLALLPQIGGILLLVGRRVARPG